VLQNGAPTAGYTVTPQSCGGGSASNGVMRLNDCHHGMLLNAASATSDALYGSEVIFPAAAAGSTASVTPAVTTSEYVERHAVQVGIHRQVNSFVSARIQYFYRFVQRRQCCEARDCKWFCRKPSLIWH